MEIETLNKNGVCIAVIKSTDLLLFDASSALDLIGTVQYETGCSRVALCKDAVAEDFFRLKTGLAGEILQKFINYHMKLAVFGDFSQYTSKPLHDFIYESNHGRDIFFVSDPEEAAEKLAGV